MSLYLWFSLSYLFCFLRQESSRSLVRGLVLLNCAGGMNNKAIVDDWRIKLLLPLLWLVDFLLKQQGIASFIFERVRQRYWIYFTICQTKWYHLQVVGTINLVMLYSSQRRDNLRNVLLSVYGNQESVDEELVEVLLFSFYFGLFTILHTAF